MSNQSLGSMGSGQITSQPYQGMIRDSYNTGQNTLGQSMLGHENIGQSTMMGQSGMRGQSIAGQSALIGQNTMGQGSISDPSLDPFSMNQGMAMGAMQMQSRSAQQQQGIIVNHFQVV